MNNHPIYAVVVCFLALAASANVANAQSSDRDHPTPLTSNQISSPINADDRDKVVYYSFEAGPGEVTATLNVEPDRSSYGTNQVDIEFLLSETGVKIATLDVWTYIEAKQQVQRFTLSRRQMVTIRVWFTDANRSGGTYQLRLSGAIQIKQGGIIASLEDPPMPPFNLPSKDKTDSSSCLPKQGTLIIKMKDGSKKIVDLSEAENVTVVP